MRLASGNRIGQSGQELLTASVFSFALHGLIMAAVVLLYFSTTPKRYVPPVYNVKLVGLSAADLPQAPAAAPVQAALPKVKPEPPSKKSQIKEHRAPARHAKGDMPELAPPKAKPERTEPAKQQEARQEKAAASKPASGSTAPGVKTENVALTMPRDSQVPGAAPYMAIVSERISGNWNPPPGASGNKANLQFTIMKSGRVGDVKLVASSGNFYFDQAAMRAIYSSSPFPPLPEGFFKDEQFSVDLIPKE